MKRKLIILLAFCLSSTANIFAQTSETSTHSASVNASFGYLSYNDVLHSMPQYAEAERTIAGLRAVYEEELKRSEDDFSKKFAEYIEGQKSFPENILRKRQKELQLLMEQTLNFKTEAKALLEKKEAEVMAPLNMRVDEAIHRIGMERNYAYIINTDTKAYPFINGAIGTDITADVLMLLK
jgi:outer membrane protein